MCIRDSAKLGGRNDVYMAAFPPWSKQLRAGMHFAAETHVWIDLPALLGLMREEEGVVGQPGYLFASESMAILSRITIPREIFEAVTTCERGLYRVVWHKRYRDQKPIGHQGGQRRTDRDREDAPFPSRYIMEGEWFYCPNCSFPLGCGMPRLRLPLPLQGRGRAVAERAQGFGGPQGLRRPGTGQTRRSVRSWRGPLQ